MAGTAIDYRKLVKLLEDFQLLTGIRISFWNAAGKKCAVSGREDDSPFCSALRTVPRLDAECRRCDAIAMQTAQSTARLHVFRCHAGLQEYVYPAIQSGRLIGFFMMGQVHLPDSCGDIVETHRARWQALGLDVARLQRLYEALPVLTHEKMLAAAHMLEALAGYVYMNGLVRRLESPLSERISEYIRGNLKRRITIDDVAAELNVSRSTICHTIRAEMDTSVVALTKLYRVEKTAALMLTGAQLSEAAREAGFSSASYCVRVFKQVRGMSPEQFERDAAQSEGPHRRYMEIEGA